MDDTVSTVTTAAPETTANLPVAVAEPIPDAYHPRDFTSERVYMLCATDEADPDWPYLTNLAAASALGVPWLPPKMTAYGENSNSFMVADGALQTIRSRAAHLGHGNLRVEMDRRSGRFMRPTNGRRGIAGRGTLSFWGPNPYGMLCLVAMGPVPTQNYDNIVVPITEGSGLIVLLETKNGTLRLPGAYAKHPKAEVVHNAAAAAGASDEAVKKIVSMAKSVTVTAPPSDDDTDNAWRHTLAFYVAAPIGQENMFEFKVASGLGWYSVAALDKLDPTSGAVIGEALKRMMHDAVEAQQTVMVDVVMACLKKRWVNTL